MIPYHGLPITPEVAAVAAVQGGHAFVSFAHPQQLGLAVDLCQSFAVDNGAFSAWRSGSPITDWKPYYEWVRNVSRFPAFDWAVVPDVIDGSEEANDAMLAEWPLPRNLAVPVWHLHESLDRLKRLANAWPRVALGSSGQWSTPATAAWWERTNAAMQVVCDADGLPRVKLHGLRMLNSCVTEHVPLSSADSCNIAMNIGIDSAWKGAYQPIGKPARAAVMRQRIEASTTATRWSGPPTEQHQGKLF